MYSVHSLRSYFSNCYLHSQTDSSRSALLKPLVFPILIITAHLFIWLYICLQVIGHRYEDISLIHTASILSTKFLVGLCVSPLAETTKPHLILFWAQILASDVQSICLFGAHLRIKSPKFAAFCLYCFTVALIAASLAFNYWVRHYIVTKKVRLHVPWDWQMVGMKDPFLNEPHTVPGSASFVHRR